MLSDRFTSALVYAAEVHADQARKRGGTPYVSHLLIVAGTVLEAGGDEDAAIAALLHDAAEDQGGRQRLDDIRSRYGARVGDVVAACSDSLTAIGEPKLPWLERKKDFIARLPVCGRDVHLVAAADKLANTRSMIGDVMEHGAGAMKTFTGGIDGTLWYLRQVFDVLSAGPLRGTALLAELGREVNRLAGLLIDEVVQ